MHADLKPYRLFKDDAVQRRYERNRQEHFAEVGELVERVAMIIDGRHSALCFSPFQDGTGDYGCCCGEKRYERAREAIAIVQSAPRPTPEDGGAG